MLDIFWQSYLNEKNAELAALGRPLISRYHATDCANLKREFADWTAEEQILTTQRLIEIIHCCPMHCVAITVVASDVLNAYQSVFGKQLDNLSCKKAMCMLAGQVATDYLTAVVHDINLLVSFELVYDQGGEEEMLKAAISYLQQSMSPRFKSLASVQGDDSRTRIPLQLADFIAYECFRDRRRELYSPNSARRKSFAALLNGGLGISLRTVEKSFIEMVVRANASSLC